MRTNCNVARIITKGGGVKGIELVSGEVIGTRTIASNLHPRTTLQDLLDEDSTEAEFSNQVDHLPSRGSAFKIALALDGLPAFAAAPAGLEAAYAGCQFRLAPSLEYMDRAYDDAKYGKPSQNPIIFGLIPSVTDPNMAPPGKQILSVNVWHAPVELREADWTTERDRFGNHCIDIMASYMPNLKELISDHRFISPLDLQNEFGLRDANINHLDVTPPHMFGLRPLAGWSSYRMPVEGLYLCGSGTWPGGTVSGIPGHNASQAILSDLNPGRS